ncbi:hypothetical protein BDP55DRAFT_163536 [Colletotrichum godetiae]|uniref:Uncharacterized protein n=1 Tax=Colletotrichum godetiae TaxID=1209918 RepID=A0AAJ0ETC1_9PEZI|nr:uncharacterized protein BDP55DRAFT_163536 [Colletotrichum godetiae]KAK1674872.1 hypothetical protein BDP55DRAFT_163536 [Colletotrichum godetiae]
MSRFKSVYTRSDRAGAGFIMQFVFTLNGKVLREILELHGNIHSLRGHLLEPRTSQIFKVVEKTQQFQQEKETSFTPQVKMSRNKAAWLTHAKTYPMRVDDAPSPKVGLGEVVIRNVATALVSDIFS